MFTASERYAAPMSTQPSTREFWTRVPGVTAQTLEARIAEADSGTALPLCRLALDGDDLLGVINLIDADDDRYPELAPWLAGLVVDVRSRGRGVGAALVRQLLADAAALRCPVVYLGTAGPAFYARLGATVQAQPSPTDWIMRFDLG